MNEKELLSKLNDPFLMNMHYSFSDVENLYFVMDLMTGGDLSYHYHQQPGCFTEEQTKFFVACVILGLEAMHKKGFMHKDLKPANVLFDAQGYLKIADFGIAESTKPGVQQSFLGTDGYRAPEVVLHSKHDASIDYYALGVIAH